MHGRFQGAGHFVGDVAQIDIHQRFADNAQREPAHFLMQVDRLILLPAAEHLLGVRHDRAGVAIHTIAAEGRLNQTALPEPEFPFAVQ